MSIGKRLAAAGVLTVIVVLIAMLLFVDRWRGGGFQSDGPEMPLLREAIALEPGMSVADVGAGQGDLTMALAAAVGPGGHVFSTDIDSEALEQIRARVAAAAFRNVTVVQAQASNTGLPMNCCDAVIVRRVYHHVSDPAATNLSLLPALRPGGILAIIDFPPMWLWPWHGVNSELVIDEVTAAGFELVNVINDWPGRGPLESYCAVFRKPRRG